MVFEVKDTGYSTTGHLATVNANLLHSFFLISYVVMSVQSNTNFHSLMRAKLPQTMFTRKYMEKWQEIKGTVNAAWGQIYTLQISVTGRKYTISSNLNSIRRIISVLTFHHST